MIKTVIFDFDGTLVDSKDIFLPIYNQLAEKHGLRTVSAEDFERLKHLSMMERVKAMDFPIHKLPRFVPEFYPLYRAAMGELSLSPGIRELLEALQSSGVRMAVISSNSEQNIREFFAKQQIEGIEQVIGSPRIFGKDVVISKFLRANHLQPSEVIYVGDEQRDIVACKKCGIKIIWVEWGFEARNVVEPEHPDYMVNVPTEILSIIRDNRCEGVPQ